MTGRGAKAASEPSADPLHALHAELEALLDAARAKAVALEQAFEADPHDVDEDGPTCDGAFVVWGILLRLEALHVDRASLAAALRAHEQRKPHSRPSPGSA